VFLCTFASSCFASSCLIWCTYANILLVLLIHYILPFGHIEKCLSRALEEGKIWTWGFGGYGRLGHKVQKDEFSPKMVEIQVGPCRHCLPRHGHAFATLVR
jgi:hypothetical protein